MSSADHVKREVERRLDQVRDDPEARERYDRNGDGLVDEEEWELARRQIRAEVQSELDAEDAGREQTPAESDPEAKIAGYPAVLEDRFELLEQLGAGSQGRALLAHDRETDQQVVVKHLALGDAPDWKAIELFEREGEVLENLDHPAIPDYVDSFETEFEASPGTQFFLAQEYVDGEALEERLEGGERWDRDEAVDFLIEMFDILEYLEGLNPPVVHRDIKASNVIRREDGSYALIDFGAVQSVLPEASGSSTVIGTGGYVPPEQLMGRSEPASDLYAVGATVLHMMSGTHPAKLPMDQMRFRVAEIIDEPGPFVDFVDQLVDPFVEGRFGSVDAARSALEDALETIRKLRTLLTRVSTALPGESPVDIETDSSGTRVELPDPAWLKLAFAVIALHAIGVAATGLNVYFFVSLVLLLGLCLLGLRGKRLQCDRNTLCIESRPLGLPAGSDTVATDDIDEVVLHDGSVKVVSGVRTLEFPHLPGETENKAVKKEIDKWVEVTD